MQASFSLNINGETTPSFPLANGVHQGDPLSPYLFAVVMQVLSSMFKQAEQNGELVPMACGSTAVSHIIFTDDLMVFLKADKKNARGLKKILDDFSARSGLNINFPKSAIYFGGMVKDRRWIETHLSLSVGEHPVSYLGLPLLSKRLSAKDYAPLIQVVKDRLQTWKAKYLSYAGRLELIRSMLSSLHLY